MIDWNNIVKAVFIGVLIALLIFAIYMFSKVEIPTAYGAIAYPDNLWKGIIGEAVGEGYTGMYAVACVYRNRINKGMSLGCVALQRKDLESFLNKSRPFHFIAKKIVRDVFEGNAKDITKGATHYENLEDFPMPKWAKDMKVICKIGKHTFFKER